MEATVVLDLKLGFNDLETQFQLLGQQFELELKDCKFTGRCFINREIHGINFSLYHVNETTGIDMNLFPTGVVKFNQHKIIQGKNLTHTPIINKEPYIFDLKKPDEKIKLFTTLELLLKD